MSTINNVLCRFFVVFLMGYASCSVGDTETRPAEYIVKINNISMHSNSAKNILQHIKDSKRNISAYDNVKHEVVSLPVVEKNMDITIDGDDFMRIISKLYNSCFVEDEKFGHVIYEDENRKCKRLIEGDIDMDLCVDKKSKIVLELPYRKV